MKKFAAIFLAVLFSISVSGCRRKVDPNAPAPPPPKKVQLVWWNLFEDCSVFRGQIQQFESTNPGAKINCKSFSDAAEFEKVLINEIAEGGGPDIFSIQNTKVDTHRGKISPAPSAVFTPAEFQNTFFSVAADDLILPDDATGVQKVFAIPLYIDTLALYFNKKIFRDNLPSTDEPAKTWENLKQQVYAITRRDNSIERFALSGIAMGRADNILRAVDILQLLFLQFDTQMFDKKTGKAIFAQQQGTFEGTGKPFYRGAEVLKLFTSFSSPSWKNYSWNQLITSFDGEQKEVGTFLREKTAMIFGYSQLYENLKSEIEAAKKSGKKSTIKLENVGVAAVPQIVDPAESGEQDSLASYFPLTVSRNSKSPELSWQFLKFLSSSQSLQDFHEKTHRPTSRKDMVDGQMSENIFGVFARQASFAKSLETIEDESFELVFAAVIDEIVKSKATIEKALQSAEEKMSCVFQKKLGKKKLAEKCF